MRKLFSLFVALLATTTLFAQRFQAGDLFYEVVNEDITLEKPYVSNPGYGHTTVVLYIPENTPAGCYAVGTMNSYNVSNTDFMFTPVEGANSERWVACTFEYYYPVELYVLAIPSEPNFSLGWSFQWDSPAEDNVVILEGAGSFIYDYGESKLGELEDNAVIYIEIKKWANDPYIESVPCETAAFKHPWGGGAWLYREATKTAEGTFELNAIYGNAGVNVATDVTGASENWYPTDQIEFVGDVAIGDSVNFKFISEKRTIGRWIITLIEKGNGTNNPWYVPSQNFPTAPQKRSSANSSHQVVVTYQHERSTENYQYLTIANIPATVEYRGKTYDVVGIKEGAFAYSSIASISIPNSVTSIGDSAFVKCNLFDTIYCYAANPPVVESNTFVNNDETNNYEAKLYVPCESLEAYKAHEVWGRFSNIQCIEEDEEEEKTKSYIHYTSSDGNIVTPNAYFSATEVFGANIISNTYENGQGIITFDGPVTSIGQEAFYACTSLRSISIPNSVTTIGYLAFTGCSSLTSISIPKSVTEIGDYAFDGCSSLTSVTIPNSVTYIGIGAFQNCDSLTSVTLPENITNIGDGAFSGCFSLNAIYCYIVTPIQITPRTFSSSYYKAILYVPCESLDAYLADKVWERFDNIQCIGNEIPKVGNSIYYTSSDGNIVNPYKADGFDAKIISNTYENGRGTITFGGLVGSIRDSAFYSCHRLTSITIPKYVDEIGAYAFYECSLLYSITCLETTPPSALDSSRPKQYSFQNYDATIYVPCESLEAYKAHEVWGRFNTIQCLEDSIPDPTERVLSCAEAVTVCLETGATATTEEYTIHGYVTEITTEYSEQYKNISFYMADTKDGGQVLFTYRIKPMYEADIAVKVGDFVEVVGKLVNYNGYLPEVYPGVYTIVNEPELPTGTSDIQLPTSNTKKVVKDGQLLILRDGKTYTIMGTEVK